jgi:hypothetical protein
MSREARRRRPMRTASGFIGRGGRDLKPGPGASAGTAGYDSGFNGSSAGRTGNEDAQRASGAGEVVHGCYRDFTQELPGKLLTTRAKPGQSHLREKR